MDISEISRSDPNPGLQPQKRMALIKGAACSSCRKSKTKCNGANPCNRCLLTNTPEDCEYTKGQERSKIQLMEEEIQYLESRIEELQHPPATNETIILHQAYPTPGPLLNGITVNPSQALSKKLLKSFLPFASVYGFFLEPNRFCRAMASSFDLRPAQCLISSVQLIGLTLCRDSDIKSQEQYFLGRALHDAAYGLSYHHPDRILHTLQSEVLLAVYFFSLGRMLEGQYHIALSVSLALNEGMHRIRPKMQPCSPNSLSDGERIHAFWTVFTLDNSWAVALDTHNSIDNGSETNWLQVDTPWPLDLEAYTKEYGTSLRSGRTIENFLHTPPTTDICVSHKAVHAQVACLLERVCDLSKTYVLGVPPSQLADFDASFNSLNSIIDCFKQFIPPIHVDITDSSRIRTLVVAHSLLHLAIIRLNGLVRRQADGHIRKQIQSARAIVDIVTSISSQQLIILDPIISVTWLDATQVLANETRIAGSRRAPWVQTDHSEAHAPMLRALAQGINAMRLFASSCKVIAQQVDKIQKIYDSIKTECS